MNNEFEKTVIEKNLNKINAELNLDLKPCDYFTGIRLSSKGEYYFNILLNNKIATKEYRETIDLIEKLDFILRVEPNGVNRVAVFFLIIIINNIKMEKFNEYLANLIKLDTDKNELSQRYFNSFLKDKNIENEYMLLINKRRDFLKFVASEYPCTIENEYHTDKDGNVEYLKDIIHDIILEGMDDSLFKLDSHLEVTYLGCNYDNIYRRLVSYFFVKYGDKFYVQKVSRADSIYYMNGVGKVYKLNYI